MLGVRGSTGPRAGRGLLGVTLPGELRGQTPNHGGLAQAAERSKSTEPWRVAKGKVRLTEVEGEDAEARAESGTARQSRVLGGQGGHSTGPSGRRGTAQSPGSCRAPGCPSLGITQHITHFWAVLAAPHGIITQMI